MGSVSIDVHGKEREFRPLTLSDKNVVKYLILHRSKVDVVYHSNTNININQAGDVFEFNQELIALYASLDSIIKKIKLNSKEKEFLNMIFEGNTISDIIHIHKLYAQKTAYRTLNKIVDCIVDENFSNWKIIFNDTIMKG